MSTSLRILLGVPHNPFESMGGAEQYAKNLADWHHQHGQVIRIVCVDRDEVFASGGMRRTEKVNGMAVDRLKLPEDHRQARLGWIYNSNYTERVIRNIAAQFKPDIFHLVSGYLLTGSTINAMRDLGIPVVVSLLDYWFFCPRLHRVRSNGDLCEQTDYGADCVRCLAEEFRRYRLPARYVPTLAGFAWTAAGKLPILKGRLQRLIEKYQVRRQFLADVLSSVQAIISPSRHVLALAASEGIADDKLYNIPHGLPEVFLHQRDQRRRSDKLRLGYFGSITPLKGVHVVIDAVKKFSASDGVQLTVFGPLHHSPRYAKQLQWIARKIPWIQFHGPLSYERVAETMADLDAVIIPTLCFETFSFVMHEAFATGTPVLCSRTPTTGTLICENRNGLFFKRNNPDDLNSIICQLLRNPDLLEQLRGNIGDVQTLDKEMRRTERLYFEVSEKASAKPKADPSQLSSSPKFARDHTKYHKLKFDP